MESEPAWHPLHARVNGTDGVSGGLNLRYEFWERVLWRDTHIAKVMGKGKSQVGKMDAILTDPHLDTRIKLCILTNVVIPKLEYAGEVWEGNAQFVKQLDTVQMTAARKILGCSSTTSYTILRAELGMFPLETNRDV